MRGRLSETASSMMAAGSARAGPRGSRSSRVGRELRWARWRSAKAWRPTGWDGCGRIHFVRSADRACSMRLATSWWDSPAVDPSDRNPARAMTRANGRTRAATASSSDFWERARHRRRLTGGGPLSPAGASPGLTARAMSWALIAPMTLGSHACRDQGRRSHSF
jgi:hypothetical protein